jgi:hypothetical protein
VAKIRAVAAATDTANDAALAARYYSELKELRRKLRVLEMQKHLVLAAARPALGRKWADNIANRLLDAWFEKKSGGAGDCSEVPSFRGYAPVGRPGQYVLYDDDRLHKATGLSSEEWNEWWSAVGPELAATNQRGEPRANGTVVGGKVVADEGVVRDDHQLLLFLIYVRNYPKWSDMSREFHVH